VNGVPSVSSAYISGACLDLGAAAGDIHRLWIAEQRRAGVP